MIGSSARSRVFSCLAAVGLLTASLASTVGGTAAVAAAPPPNACEGHEGVTVVVDFTDVGGSIEVGCAEGDPANGREALESAGFTPADSTPGLICTINNFPDPCPEKFDGNFWSYWSAEADGMWTSYQVGADEADPAPGSFEGWRYFDGSAGPGMTPAEAVDATTDRPSGATDPMEEPDSHSTLPIILGGVGIVLVGAIVVLTIRRRKS